MAKMQSSTVFHFKPFSKKQRMVLNWWTETSPVKDMDGIVADGAIRSGKTLMLSLSFVMWSMESFDGQNFAICSKSVGSCRRNVIFWLKLMLRGRGYKVNDRRGENLLIIRKGNTENYYYIFGGRDERSQDFIQGITLAGVLLDEVALMPESFVNQATGRCSVDGSKLWFNCNPSYPSHFFKTEWIDQRKEKRLLYLHFTMDDNLALSERVKKRYKSMYSGVFYDRYILGMWCLAEGIIYPMYQDALEEAPNTPVDAYRVSIDYGTQNAFAALLWEKHGNVWYAVKEYYYSGRDTGVQKTDEEYGRDLDKFVDGIEGRIKCIIDPSAASFIALLRRKGGKYSVKPADNDVMDGIRETATAMITGKLKISPTKCPNLIEELQGYVWDDTSDDRPVKVNDHACLSGDTIVETENGKCKIRDLVGKTGLVWSYNIEDGKPELKPFKNVMMTRRNAQIYKIELEDGRIIRCTDDHPILTTEGYKNIKYLKENVNGVVKSLSQTNTHTVNTVKIAKISLDTVENAYDMEVEDNHNFAINGGIIVHNCDAVRYLVKTEKIVKGKSTYTPIWN